MSKKQGMKKLDSVESTSGGESRSCTGIAEVIGRPSFSLPVVHGSFF